jgi:hypothetical protein
MRKGGYVILGIALAFVALVGYSLTHLQPIEVVEKHLERQGDRVFVEGEVRNTGNKPAAIDLEIHYYDRNGRPLGQDRLALDDLRPGSITPFKGPAHEIGGVAEFDLYLNHGRNPYGN